MTRVEAIAIISEALHAVDDSTLEAAAVHIATIANPSGLSLSDIQQAFPTETRLARTLTAHELELIDQSKVDFRLGRTRSLSESKSYVDVELARRRRLRAAI
jgi:hypothetical protein